MLETVKSSVKNATSSINVNGTKVAIATMNATLQEDGRMYTSANISEPKLFEENKASVCQDIINFMKDSLGVTDEDLKGNVQAADEDVVQEQGGIVNEE